MHAASMPFDSILLLGEALSTLAAGSYSNVENLPAAGVHCASSGSRMLSNGMVDAYLLKIKPS